VKVIYLYSPIGSLYLSSLANNLNDTWAFFVNVSQGSVYRYNVWVIFGHLHKIMRKILSKSQILKSIKMPQLAWKTLLSASIYVLWSFPSSRLMSFWVPLISSNNFKLSCLCREIWLKMSNICLVYVDLNSNLKQMK